MRGAIVTFAYNEDFNLPVWVAYYGRQFGLENLFVIDHGSTDNSLAALPNINVIRLPRSGFDELDKTNALSSLHAALLPFYDVVMVSDCDEIVVPDPAKYAGILDYVEKTSIAHVNCIGLDLVHIIDREPPLEPGRKLLSQRHYARFQRAACKPLISRESVVWGPGLHSINRAPRFDPDLFLFHLKYVDYAISVRRHLTNASNAWSERSMQQKHGAHHRVVLPEFVHQGFIVAMAHVKGGRITAFEFGAEIEAMEQSLRVDAKGLHRFAMGGGDRMLEIPDRFRDAF